jgi:outer membrane protein OmpA-like peptidoglycan-associated protein
MRHIKTFEGFNTLNEDKFKAPKLQGSITPQKKQKKSSRRLVVDLVLTHDGENVLEVPVKELPLIENPQNGAYQARVKINTENYSGEVLITLPWTKDARKVVFRPFNMGGNVEWVSWKEKRHTPKIAGDLKDPVIPRDTPELDPTKGNPIKFKGGNAMDLSANSAFEKGSAKLSSDAIKQITEFANENKGKKVSVTGFSSIDGNDAMNLKLSQARANSVAKVLKANGVTVVSSVGKGETEAFGKGEENYPKNRKVVVNFE